MPPTELIEEYIEEMSVTMERQVATNVNEIMSAGKCHDVTIISGGIGINSMLLAILNVSMDGAPGCHQHKRIDIVISC